MANNDAEKSEKNMPKKKLPILRGHIIESRIGMYNIQANC